MQVQVPVVQVQVRVVQVVHVVQVVQVLPGYRSRPWHSPYLSIYLSIYPSLSLSLSLGTLPLSGHWHSPSLWPLAPLLAVPRHSPSLSLSLSLGTLSTTGYTVPLYWLHSPSLSPKALSLSPSPSLCCAVWCRWCRCAGVQVV